MSYLNIEYHVRQHSVTICAMEERLVKTNKKNKDLQMQLTSFKQEILGKC